MTAWQLQDAKNKLSEVLDRAMDAGVQVITRRGREVAVVMSWDEYRAHFTQHGDLADFLARSPLAGSGLVVERDRSVVRPAPEL